MGNIKIWDNHNKQWLSPMSIFFDKNDNVGMVKALKIGDDPISNGWYDIEGDDLNKISIIGKIQHNTHLVPDKISLKSEFDEILGMDEPYSLLQVLEGLINSTDILLQEKSYDGLGHENVKETRDRAEDYVNKIKNYLIERNK